LPGHPAAQKKKAIPGKPARLDFHGDRQHHRPAAGFIVQELGQSVPHPDVDVAEVGPVLAALERGRDDPPASLHELFALVHIDEAAGEDLGGGGELAGLLVDRDEDDDETVGRKVGAIAEDPRPST